MHPWFLQSLPAYLTLSPKQLEAQAGRLDEELIDHMLKMPFGAGVTRARIVQAALSGDVMSTL